MDEKWIFSRPIIFLLGLRFPMANIPAVVAMMNTRIPTTRPEWRNGVSPPRGSARVAITEMIIVIPITDACVVMHP